jgi:hypothetical protein
MIARRLVCALALCVLAAPPAFAKQRQRIVRLKLGPFPIEAERDREVCKAYRIRGVPGMEVESWEARSRVSQGGAVGSHHLVAYGYTGQGTDDFPPGIVDEPGCVGLGPADFFSRRVFLAGSGGESVVGQWAVTEGSMPGDLAQVLPNSADAPGDAIVVVNSHYFNTSRRRGRGLVKVKLKLAPLDPGKRVVRQIIHGDASRDLMVPPGETGSVESTFQCDGAPNFQTEGSRNPSGDVCILAVSSHMHLRGTRFVIDYESDAGRVRLLDWPDYLHPGTAVLPLLDGNRGLLRAYTETNGFPRIRYGCEYANGTDDRPQKMGCEEEPGVVPGMSWAAAEALGILPTESHAKPCGKDGVNCDGKPCVPANLVFGPLSDDDMCILTALVYDPAPGAAPERACDFTSF